MKEEEQVVVVLVTAELVVEADDDGDIPRCAYRKAQVSSRSCSSKHSDVKHEIRQVGWGV